jgi:hypothetical protein
MVNNEGQLYTIEGVAASVLILTTVFLVLASTTVFTPAETHINDMQLEQIGNDVLAVMDMSPTWNTTRSPYPKSPLELYVETGNPAGGIAFGDEFRFLADQTTGIWKDNIKINATIFYRKGNQIQSTPFFQSDEYYNENAVTVSQWVNVDNSSGSATGLGLDRRNQTVLLEVLLWRG